MASEYGSPKLFAPDALRISKGSRLVTVTKEAGPAKTGFAEFSAEGPAYFEAHIAKHESADAALGIGLLWGPIQAAFQDSLPGFDRGLIGFHSDGCIYNAKSTSNDHLTPKWADKQVAGVGILPSATAGKSVLLFTLEGAVVWQKELPSPIDVSNTRMAFGLAGSPQVSLNFGGQPFKYAPAEALRPKTAAPAEDVTPAKPKAPERRSKTPSTRPATAGAAVGGGSSGGGGRAPSAGRGPTPGRGPSAGRGDSSRGPSRMREAGGKAAAPVATFPITEGAPLISEQGPRGFFLRKGPTDASPATAYVSFRPIEQGPVYFEVTLLGAPADVTAPCGIGLAWGPGPFNPRLLPGLESMLIGYHRDGAVYSGKAEGELIAPSAGWGPGVVVGCGILPLAPAAGETAADARYKSRLVFTRDGKAVHTKKLKAAIDASQVRAAIGLGGRGTRMSLNFAGPFKYADAQDLLPATAEIPPKTAVASGGAGTGADASVATAGAGATTSTGARAVDAKTREALEKVSGKGGPGAPFVAPTKATAVAAGTTATGAGVSSVGTTIGFAATSSVTTGTKTTSAGTTTTTTTKTVAAVASGKVDVAALQSAHIRYAARYLDDVMTGAADAVKSPADELSPALSRESLEATAAALVRAAEIIRRAAGTAGGGGAM